MVKTTNIDPIAEARARVALRYKRGKQVHRGAPSLGTHATRFMRKALPEAGPGIERLKVQWGDIVGADIAKYCAPEKLTGKKGARTLTLRVIPQAAPIIQHRGHEIRQRVAVAAGGAVESLKIIQGPLKTAPPGAQKRKVRALSGDELRDLETAVENIADPRLRAATVALGKAMLSAGPESR